MFSAGTGTVMEGLKIKRRHLEVAICLFTINL